MILLLLDPVSDLAGLAVLGGVTKAYPSHPTNLLIIARHDEEATGPCVAVLLHAAMIARSYILFE